MDYNEFDENMLTNEEIKKIFYSIKKEKYENADYLIIYGCHMKNLLNERLTHALSILESKKIKKVVITGGMGVNGDFNECEYMLDYLIKNKVSRDKIIIENKSTTTKENNENILNMLKLNDLKEKTKIILCTQEPHIVRILLHWNKLITNSNIIIISDFPDNSIISYERIIENDNLKKELNNQLKKIKYFIGKGIYSKTL